MAAEDEHLAQEMKIHHRHHHAGFPGFVFMAVETLGAPPEQQAAIDKVKEEYKKKLKPLREANASVHALLADGIAANKFEKAKIDAAVAKVALASVEVHPAVDEALDELHKVLKPEQRQALVDKVEANWSIWKEANEAEKETKAEKKEEKKEAKVDGRIAHLTKELSLTPDQAAKAKADMEAAFKEPKKFELEKSEAHIKAFAAAFVEEKFEAKKLPVAKEENGKVVTWGAERMVRFYEAITPDLTPDQRTKLAEKLREHSKENPPEGKP
jgi:Spy/CpxP family protein refolding chaperone